MAYSKNMGDLLNENKPCVSRKQLCKACQLFGMASSEEQRGSRIRITDAKAVNWKGTEGQLLKKQTLRELASPRPSYLPFYAEKLKRANSWSYDDTNVFIRGRKFYWHFSDSSEYYKAPNNEKTERNATMDLVNSNVEFSFQVYYDNITETQLKELLWTLTLGENTENSTMCHKTGHGKPIGLGSIKILVDEKTERIFDGTYDLRTENFTGIEKVEDPFAESDRKNYRELIRILDMSSMEGQNLHYPEITADSDLDISKNKVNDLAAHNWFTKNYSLGSKEPKYMLPDILKEGIDNPNGGCLMLPESIAKKNNKKR
jgi:CRISPR-associated protein (TIGR03986 family)